MVGIYKITNKINNKVYIGSSKRLQTRMKNHKRRLNGNGHINKHLQNAWNKYGEKNFKFEIIREFKINNLRIAEQFYINKYKSLDRKYGYNKTVVVANKYDKSKIIIPKKKIYFGCYDKKGKLVKVFRHIKEVYKFLGGRYTRVYDSCNSGFSLSCKGYYFCRLDVDKHKFKTKVKIKERKGRHLKIDQYTLDNEYIRTFDSAVEAACILNLTSSNITRCLNKNNIYKNYKWYYSPVT